MSAESTLRDSLNTADPNRNDVAMQDLQHGEVLNLLLRTQTPTEAALVPATDVITMAATPKALLDVNVATSGGAFTGRKKLLKGFTAADGTIRPVPAAGQATWDGATKVRLAAADLALTVNVLYTTEALSSVSYLQRSIGEQDA